MVLGSAAVIGEDSEYKLELSRDAGLTYEVVEEANNLFDLKDKCEEFDNKGWRWVVKDSNKKIVMACAIFGEIFDALHAVGEQDG